jgi:hypothetical protein
VWDHSDVVDTSLGNKRFEFVRGVLAAIVRVKADNLAPQFKLNHRLKLLELGEHLAFGRP